MKHALYGPLRLVVVRVCVCVCAALTRRADRSVAADNAAIFALTRHAAVMGTAATGSLKDAGQVVWLGSGGALVGDDGLGGSGVVGKGRDGEEKE